MGIRSVAVLALASCLAGCSEFSQPERAFSMFEGDLRFFVERASGNSSVGAPLVRITMASDREYGCANYQIEHSTTVDGEIVMIAIDGVSIGGICLTALGPARGSSELQLAPGQYSLRFRLGYLVDAYRLQVGEEIEVERVLASRTVLDPDVES